MARQRLFVAYDISNDKARQKVVKLLVKYGKRI
jgi:CRISPR/Cas system-associated endoribonuclease Cas2